MTITAADIRRALDQRERSAELSQLDALLSTGRESVIAAVSGLPPSANVDVGKLLAEARRVDEVEAMRQQQLVGDVAAQFRYFLIIADRSQLLALKWELECGASVEEALTRAQRMPALPSRRSHMPDDIEEPDEEDEEEPPRRPRVRLHRRRRARMAAKDKPGTTTPTRAKTAARGRARRAAVVSKLLSDQGPP